MGERVSDNMVAMNPLSLTTLAHHMVPVEGGTFQMDEDYPVTLSDYLLCRYPVTQTLWREVMGADPEGLYFTGTDRPVERVHWYDAVTFCNRLSEACGLDPAYIIDPDTPDPHNKSKYDDLKWSVSLVAGARGYRLPTEAEWEYAARGGKCSQGFEYSGSADLDEIGWYDDNSYGETQPTGLKAPNALGLCDLSGNVWEWCYDWYDSFSFAPQSNPVGPYHGENRVRRGGSWSRVPVYARVSRRYGWLPGRRSLNLGFRLARSL
ncbi:MAG: formylglycine-generating enzyme family protein [Bacteroidetes bacterium]|nr:MAG: formylglycine-generating enzyme family protein [Bacteroidota bacterium]